MAFTDELITDVNSIINSRGTSVRLKHFTESFSGADFDNAYLTQSGTNQWVVAFPQPLNDNKAGEDLRLLEQGAISFDGRKVFFAGSVEINPDSIIGIGSPTPIEFHVINKGIIVYSLVGTNVYKKVYVERLNTGSFIGQY